MTQKSDVFKVQVQAPPDIELRIRLRTFSDGGRAGLSSGLSRRGSRASAKDRARPQLQVTDRADLPRTHVRRLGSVLVATPREFESRILRHCDLVERCRRVAVGAVDAMCQ